MEVLERDVARSVSLMRSPLADKGYKLCNVANDRRLNLDGLVVKQYQHLCM